MIFFSKSTISNRLHVTLFSLKCCFSIKYIFCCSDPNAYFQVLDLIKPVTMKNYLQRMLLSNNDGIRELVCWYNVKIFILQSATVLQKNTRPDFKTSICLCFRDFHSQFQRIRVDQLRTYTYIYIYVYHLIC